MSDNTTTPSDLDLLIARMNDLAREIGEMEPDDPRLGVRLQELCTLTELSKSLKTERNKNHEKAEKNGDSTATAKRATPVD